jgi:hypothetical protein
MYTNLMVDIENTLGKLAGVTGAREGQISNRESQGNVEREVSQTSHITEKWFAIDANFRKRVLTKFLECCKYAYKKNPKKGQFLLDDMGQHMVTKFDEFVASEYDIHVSNSTNDTQLYEDLRALSQAAIQNGQATIADLVAISQSESVQEVSKRLQDSARKIKEENQQMEEKKLASQEGQTKAMLEDKNMQRQIDLKVHDDEIAVKREKIQADLQIAGMREVNSNMRHAADGERIDTDKNGIDDYLDIRRTDVDEKYKQDQVRIAEDKLAETQRANQAREEIQKEALDIKSAQK